MHLGSGIYPSPSGQEATSRISRHTYGFFVTQSKQILPYSSAFSNVSWNLRDPKRF